MNAYIDEIDSPVGNIAIAADDQGALIRLWFGQERNPSSFERKLEREGYALTREDHITAQARQQLSEYFAGERQEFRLPLATRGSTFQEEVWKELSHIPFGETLTYGQLADAIGMPREAKAVGAACAANPLLLVIPCHRVVASGGSLRGFAAGLHIKEQLLRFESGQRFLAA